VADTYRCFSSVDVVRSSEGEWQFCVSYFYVCLQGNRPSAICQGFLPVRIYWLIFCRSVS